MGRGAPIDDRPQDTKRQGGLGSEKKRIQTLARQLAAGHDPKEIVQDMRVPFLRVFPNQSGHSRPTFETLNREIFLAAQP